MPRPSARRASAAILSATLAAALLSAPLLAQEEDAGAASEAAEAERYADCLRLSGDDPEEAFESAIAWESLGGGAAARHCAALALIGLGQYAEAGERLEALAKAVARSQPELTVGALAQAAQAWLLAGDLERAYAVQTTALELAPEDVELLVDRAVTLAEAENYAEALADLNRALALAPGRPDILVYRASAFRFLDNLPAALEDVERALLVDPNNPEGLLERGNLRRLEGDLDGARDDWQRAATLAEGLPTGDAAQANIATLDVRQD